jgi:hypothetical protein
MKVAATFCEAALAVLTEGFNTANEEISIEKTIT